MYFMATISNSGRVFKVSDLNASCIIAKHFDKVEVPRSSYRNIEWIRKIFHSVFTVIYSCYNICHKYAAKISYVSKTSIYINICANQICINSNGVWGIINASIQVQVVRKCNLSKWADNVDSDWLSRPDWL